MPSFELPEDQGLDALLGDDMASRLERWAADARVDAAVRQRSSERWLRQQAEEEATFAGVLVDLAERRVPVAIRTAAGRSHRGRVTQVGADFVQVSVPGAGDVLVAMDVISSLQVARDVALATGDRVVGSRVSLAEMIIGLAAERERALFVPRSGGDPVCGTVRSVGQDLVVVRLDGDRGGSGGTAYLPLPSIGEVVPAV